MIRYALRCAEGHGFESWFRSSDAFDALRDEGLLSCAICGSAKVEKALMAPSLGAAARKQDAAEAAQAAQATQAGAPQPAPASPPVPAPAAPVPSLSAPSSPLEAAIRELRARVEANAEHVGRRFAAEARAIHEGEAEARAIYGEASGEEVRHLIEDGVEIAPLPWTSRRDA